MLKTFLLPIDACIRETEDTISYRFAQPKVDRIHYHAGQYITVKVEIEGENYWRSYSISSTPRLEDYLSITVKKVTDGKVSSYIHEHWAKGTMVSFIKPAGRFIASFGVKEARHFVLWGLGSGITPLMSILKGGLYHEPHSEVSLVYGSRHEKQIIFGDQLSHLEELFLSRLKVIHHLSQFRGPQTFRIRPGRLLDIKGIYQEISARSDLPEVHYICGPDQWMDHVEHHLRQGGVEADRIMRESYHAGAEIAQMQKEASGPTYKVKVKMKGQNFEVWVPPGQTMLDAALSQGVKLPHSCKKGTCSTCMGHLNTGKVEMLKPDALLDFEIELGKVLTCQMIPLSDEIEIEIG